MLDNWRTHSEYLSSMVPQFLMMLAANPRIEVKYFTAFQKVFLMNLDCVWEDFLPRFSFLGKPSDQQPEILRSFMLMAHFRWYSLDGWVAHARASDVLCCLVGTTPDRFPGASTHRDFYRRLWLGHEEDHVKLPHKKPEGKLKKNMKLPLKNPGIIENSK